MLRKASHTLYVNGKMSHEEMHNYHMAVTEREVINGCLSVRNVKVTVGQLLACRCFGLKDGLVKSLLRNLKCSLKPFRFLKCLGQFVNSGQLNQKIDSSHRLAAVNPVV